MKTEIDVRQAGPADAEVLTDLAFEYLAWAVDRLREEYGVEWPLIRREDVGDSLEGYTSGGVVLVAERSDGAVGMGAMRHVREDVVEIKRMFVRPSARGQRAGARILDHLLDEARSRGARRVLLDTVRRAYRGPTGSVSELPRADGTPAPIRGSTRRHFGAETVIFRA